MLEVSFMLIKNVKCFTKLIVVCAIKEHVVSNSLPSINSMEDIPKFSPVYYSFRFRTY
jgi:hypothetical protein